ncbi:unnamed protein product [Arctogadus glacialis]
MALGLGEAMGLGLGEAMALGLGEAMALGLGEAMALGLGEAMALGLGEAMALGLGEAMALGLGEAMALGLGEAMALGNATERPPHMSGPWAPDDSFLTLGSYRLPGSALLFTGCLKLPDTPGRRGPRHRQKPGEVSLGGGGRELGPYHCYTNSRVNVQRSGVELVVVVVVGKHG